MRLSLATIPNSGRTTYAAWSKHLQKRNNHFGGADLVISGNVPQGAGLSSSASLEVAVGTVFQQLYHLPLDGAQIALNGQEAENQFVGCNCGIMDQLISALGKKDHALLIDCRTLGTKAVSMPKGVAVVIINSNFKRTAGAAVNTTPAANSVKPARVSSSSPLCVTLSLHSLMPWPTSWTRLWRNACAMC